MECPPEKMEKDETYKRLMLIAAGAAVAGNCESCLTTVVAELKRAGVPDAEIRGAVEVGQTVKERRAAIIKETAQRLAGARLSDISVSEEHPLEEKEQAAPSSGRERSKPNELSLLSDLR